MGELNKAGADAKNTEGLQAGKGDENFDHIRQQLLQRPKTEQAEGRLGAANPEGDHARIPATVRTDLDRSENFVYKELDKFKKLMPDEADPRSVKPFETQEQVDTRFAGINWNDYDRLRKAMGDRNDPQKQHLSEFDKSMLDLLEQEALLKNFAGVSMLGDGLTRNAGKYRDLLQTFKKDMQAIGHNCDVKDGRFTIE